MSVRVRQTFSVARLTYQNLALAIDNGELDGLEIHSCCILASGQSGSIASTISRFKADLTFAVGTQDAASDFGQCISQQPLRPSAKNLV